MGADGEKHNSVGADASASQRDVPCSLLSLHPLYHRIFLIFLPPYMEIKCIFISHSQFCSVLQMHLWSIGTQGSVCLAGSSVILVLPVMSFLLAFHWVKGHLGRSYASH